MLPETELGGVAAVCTGLSIKQQILDEYNRNRMDCICDMEGSSLLDAYLAAQSALNIVSG